MKWSAARSVTEDELVLEDRYELGFEKAARRIARRSAKHDIHGSWVIFGKAPMRIREY
jgi:hypothetical protein